MFSPLLLLLFIPAPTPASALGQRFTEGIALANRIDSQVDKYWETNQIRPAGTSTDAEFLRRLTLDLAGRIPTYQEALTFVEEPSPHKREQAIRRLVSSPEFALQMGRVLEEIVQGKYAGNPASVNYFRSALARHESWDRIFREVLLGPWDNPQLQGADGFMKKRAGNLDDLTNDTARAFFGVNVSCAKCHDHPLVPSWTQDHYFGMAAFFYRTVEGSKGRTGKNTISESPTGEVSFVTTRGERRNAKLMFLSSKIVREPASGTSSPTPGRRQLLVKAALEEQTFFRRAVANQLWAYFFGRGLVHPVDQMHSANPPSIPDVLEMLGDDLAAHGYDLERLVIALVSSKTYQRSSSSSTSDEFHDGDFARAILRPLTPEQYALSFILATGNSADALTGSADKIARAYKDLENQATGLTRFQVLEPRNDRFQGSTGEALFLSNNPQVQNLLAPAGNNLTARLARIPATPDLVRAVVWTVFGRSPEPDELGYLVHWINEKKPAERSAACAELAWALLTSAEFRFIH